MGNRAFAKAAIEPYRVGHHIVTHEAPLRS
jgi:hypothetical protein